MPGGTVNVPWWCIPILSEHIGQLDMGKQKLIDTAKWIHWWSFTTFASWQVLISQRVHRCFLLTVWAHKPMWLTTLIPINMISTGIYFLYIVIVDPIVTFHSPSWIRMWLTLQIQSKQYPSTCMVPEGKGQGHRVLPTSYYAPVQTKPKETIPVAYEWHSYIHSWSERAPFLFVESGDNFYCIRLLHELVYMTLWW